MIVSITKIKSVSLLKSMSLFGVEYRLKKQMKEVKCLKYRSLKLFRIVYTMTLWRDHEHMLEFRNNGEHRNVMKDIGKIAVYGAYVSYETEKSPSWRSAIKMLDEKGKKVNY
ncbi:hypothetical protein [Flavobacterium sp. JRM]|uniref:hypothetical protein n=2 Tax=unclassified Flavobacterium TaxID=196869 RepID=UPI00057FDF4E